MTSKAVRAAKKTNKSELSKAAENKIEIANKASIKAAELIMEVYKQLLKDGWTEIQAGDICRERLIIYSKSYIRKTLPDSSKHDSMRRPPLPHKEEGGVEGEGEKNEAQIAILESQIPNVPAAEEIEQPRLTEDSGTTISSMEEEIAQPQSRQAQQLEEEEPKEIYQISPDEYSIHDLPKYDLELRGKIIVYLDRENKRLHKLNAELTDMLNQITEVKNEKPLLSSSSSKTSAPTAAPPLRIASYQEACRYVNSQGIKSREQWRQFLRDHSIPPNIPRRPDNEYGEKKTGEWKGWKEFFEGLPATTIRRSKK